MNPAAIRWAMRQDRCGRTAKAVLFVLAARADDAGEITIDQGTIGAYVEVGGRAVCHAIQRLVDIGLIEKSRSCGGCVPIRYRLNMRGATT